MSKLWFLVRTLVALIVIGSLVVGGVAIYRTGWSQGYVAGQLTAEGEDMVTAPYPHYGFGYMGRPFGFAPFLFGAGLLFLLFITVGGLIRLLAWKKVMAGGPWMTTGGPRGRHWNRPHGPMPPWCWGWDKASEEETKQTEAEPDVETGAAEV